MVKTPKLSSKSKKVSPKVDQSIYNSKNANIASSDSSASIQQQVTDFYHVTRKRFETRNKETDKTLTASLSPSPTLFRHLDSQQSSKPAIDSDGFAIPFPINATEKVDETTAITTCYRSVSTPPTSHSSTPTNSSSRSSSHSGTPATPIKRHALPLNHVDTRSTPSPLKRPKGCYTEPSRASPSSMSTVISSSLPSTPLAVASMSTECRQLQLKGTLAARRRLVLTNQPEESPDIGLFNRSPLNPIAETTSSPDKFGPADSIQHKGQRRDLLSSDEFLQTSPASPSRETRGYVMPRHYTEVLDNLESTDRVLSLMYNRKQTCTYARLKAGVQQITRRYFVHYLFYRFTS